MVRRRVREILGSLNQDPYMPNGGGENAADLMTPEEEKAFLDEKCKSLEKLLPMTKDELDDEIDELAFQWTNPYAGFKDWSGIGRSKQKVRFVRRHIETFKKFRLIKPIALKHPTTALQQKRGQFDKENRDTDLSGSWIKNEETTAGFTYEDLVKVTNGNKFEDWVLPQMGDTVTGTVVLINEDGAFCEIGAKAWALMPTENCSLAPIGHAKEVLKVGQQIEAKVMGVNCASKTPGDEYSLQCHLSLRELQRTMAWDFMRQQFSAGGGAAEFDVFVLEVRPWGCLVQTKVGLYGKIETRNLGNAAGDSSLIGQTLRVTLKEIREENMMVQKPLYPSECAFSFSYVDSLQKELAKTLLPGTVVDCKVQELFAGLIKVNVNGVLLEIRKIDISANSNYNIEDEFVIGEELKAYVCDTMATGGMVKLSTRCLEFKSGAMIAARKEVIKRAEASAKKYREKEERTLKQTMERVEGALDGLLGGPSSGKGEDLELPKKKDKPSAGQIILDDEDDDVF
eukprot:TRINITY_DN98237_c0_g1_i1.p1 TRINITY_DN98237_c0_g1~~TRINITY_DN98237_c0_g1_i1.p1  ORF type:complete len:521 (+),score=127.96 TRINITY_DN98237_c0_g1_i1:28-1563(+)